MNFKTVGDDAIVAYQELGRSAKTPGGYSYDDSGTIHLRVNKELHELADTTTTTITEDIPIVISMRMLETAIQRRVCRKLIPTDSSLVGKPGSSIRYPNLNQISAGAWSAGAALTAPALDTGSGVTVTPSKFGVEVDVLAEVIEDGMHGWVETAGREAGRALAQYDDQLGLYTLIANAGTLTNKSASGWDASSNSQANVSTDIRTAMQGVENNSYNATHLVFNSGLNTYLRNFDYFIDASKFGGQPIHSEAKNELRHAGIIGEIYGALVVTTPNIASDAVGGSVTDCFMAIDADFAGAYVDKRPITVKSWEEVQKDRLLVVGGLRVGVAVWQPSAIYGYTDVVNP